MTIKELLLQEIESSPESLLEETLDFLRSLKKNEETFPTNIPKLHISPDNLSDSSQLPYHPASGRSILRHAGTWEGDDFQECLELVYNTRGKAKFDYNFHDA